MMFIRRLIRPTFIVIGNKLWVWLGGIVGLLIISGVLWVWWNKSATVPNAYFSEQPSLSISAPADNNSVQFQFETLQPDSSGENYFVNYRLQRENFRQETKVMLSELLNSTVKKTQEQAQVKWLELSTKIQQEGEIENLLKIKGFQDAVVDVLPENVTVFVYAPNLTANEVNLIQDIVVRVTKVRLDKITITTKK